MKIKIIKTIQRLEDYSAISKASKPYTIYSCICDIETDGVQIIGQTIKTMNKELFEQIKEGAELDDCERQDYQGKVSYMIKKPFTSSYKPAMQQKKVSWEKYVNLVTLCKGIAVNVGGDKPSEYFDKILGCASVMVDLETLPGDEVPM